MANNKGTINMVLTISGTIGTFMAIDYSKYSTFFLHWNWFAITVSLFVGLMIYLIFWNIGRIIKEGILKTELIVKEGVKNEYDNLKTLIKKEVTLEIYNDISKITTETIEQNGTYKKLDGVFKKLDEVQEYWRNRQLTAYRIVRDIIVNKKFNEPEKQKQHNEFMGAYFYNSQFTIKDLEEFELSKDILIEAKRLYHTDELSKL